jgi:amino acid transporter
MERYTLGPLQRLLLGRPLPTSASSHERLTRPRALGAFGLDALSSVAYGPDEILYVLLLASSAGLAYDLPIAVAIVLLLLIVSTSYRQTIFAYPQGGGSYTVARENLGTNAGLVAAAALMVDYLTTVAVSITAGVQAITAFVPALYPHRVVIDVACILLLLLINLRGVREAGAAFVIPTYVFIGSLGLLVLWGLLHIGSLAAHAHPPPAPPATEGVTLFLLLRAFAGGCTAMTGIEALANGVPAFQRPESKNAAATLLWLACMLAVLFMGVALLGRVVGAVPSEQANVIAQIGMAVVGSSPLFYLVQLSAAVILVLAANTSYNGFPRLAAIMAADDFFPHQFSHRGIRLAYSNGILALSALAIALVIVFAGSTHALIPLFAVGVFLCFTLSQAGMVRHWLRDRTPGWEYKLAINGLGAVTTGVVTLIVVITKFTQGAWIVVLLVPALVALFHAIHEAYRRERLALAVYGPPEPVAAPHGMLVPVDRLNRAVAESIAYAQSLGDNVVAVHVAVDEDHARQLRREWEQWGTRVPLEILPSPYREVLEPLLAHIKERCKNEPSRLTVVVPTVVPHLWPAEALHNQYALALQLSLRTVPNVVVTTVPVQI